MKDGKFIFDSPELLFKLKMNRECFFLKKMKIKFIVEEKNIENILRIEKKNQECLEVILINLPF